MFDIPIRCVLSTDMKYTHETPGRCKKLNGRSHSNCYEQYKYIVLIVAASILLIVTLMRLTYFIISMQNVYNASVDVQPESRMERIIRANHPLGRRSLSEEWTGKVIDEGSSLNDQTKLTDWITQAAEGDALSTINEGDTDTREISRARRDCELNAKHCEMLLEKLQEYLKTLDKFSTTDDENPIRTSYEYLKKCLQCKDLQFTNANEFDANHTPRSKDLYFPHDYVEQNRSSDSGIAIIKLLNNEEAEEDSKRTEVNRMEAEKVQVTVSTMDDASQGIANQSLKNTSLSTSETTTMSVDHTESDGSSQVYKNATDTNNNSTANNDKQPNSNITANDSPIIKVQSNESIPATPKVYQQNHAIAESKITTSDTVTMQFTATGSESTTQHSTITGDAEKTTAAVDSAGSTEAGTRSSFYVTKQTAITENVTSVPAGYDVTGIDGGDTTHPSGYPSFEGHPENRSNLAVNGSRSMDSYYAYQQMSADRFQKDDSKPIQATAESTKSFQQLQLTPTMWTMPQLVCFYGQSPNMPSSSGAAFYPGSSSPSGPSNRGLLPQNHQSSLQPNYMQVQANTVQFLPRFNYAGNQAQPMGQGIGPTGPAMSNMPIFSANQQPQQPNANTPYFCGYMSLPTLRFPPIPGTSHSDRSADQTEDLAPESQKDGAINWQSYLGYPPLSGCPIDHHQCNNLACVPKVKWCDGRVDCPDASDETRCSCRDRISRDRLCDGYFDCPHGEDELGCFDCSTDSFSCDDWDKRYSSDNCVPLSQRCDGIKQCSNGKDELDCNILSESYLDRKDVYGQNLYRFTIGYTQGYLHKNVRGQWYPVCSNTSSWAMDACASEIGQPVTTMPEIQIVRVPENTFKDPYVKEENGQAKITSCAEWAVYVKCPPLPCGTRALSRQDSSPAFDTTRNNYMSRRHVEEQFVSTAAKFNKLYLETLGLLDPVSEEDQDETLVGSQSRVVGGRASQPRAWPFLVAIYRDGYFHCGGVILNEAYVLTAGHCMEKYESHYYELQAGMLRRLSFSPMAQSRKARHVIIHPDYEVQNMQNDIAIIMLDEYFLFNRWVRQVCLPALNTAGLEWIHGPSPQSMCVAIGWGAIRENGPDPDHLREVEVPILPSCKYISDQNDATICAGYPEGGHDACQGDSGGPLMCRNPNLESQWYVAGMISHGDGCARPNEPGVYMKISYYVDWIQETFKTLNNFTTPSAGEPLDKCPGFSCEGGLGKCLPEEYRCNLIVDCLDGEDEISCSSQMKHEKYRQSDNKFVKPQTDEASFNATENQMDTEATPTSFNLFNKTEVQTENDKNSRIENIDATTPEMIISSVRLTFTCKSLIQTITIDKRCDKHLDCEDGTDEDDCTCKEYLSKLQPTAICDGHLDCDDETDEKDCDICLANEFHCKRSGSCIPIADRCNSNFDCPLREDELDCLALTDGRYVNTDKDDRPILNMEGILSRYYKGRWQVQCFQPAALKNNTVSKIGKNMCEYLGFANFQSLDKIVVNQRTLETRFSRRWSYMRPSEHDAMNEEEKTCEALRIRCRPVLSNSADSHVIVDPRTGNYTYLWPWLAAIFVDGRYRCSALLLEPDWLLSSSSCTKDIRLSVNYTTALLGQSRSYLYVDGPYQQISVVDEIRDVKTSDVSLLHLKTAAIFTRYVQPLFLEKKIYPPARHDLCVAVGTDKEHVTRTIFLQPVLEDCDKCYRCFVRISGSECPSNGTLSNWDGTVFCRSENGWYPSAVFGENDDLCSSRSTRNLTSIDYIHAYISQALGKELQPTPEPACDGVRCNIGQCVPWTRGCDNVADCRDGADERNDTCVNKSLQNRSNDGAKCSAIDLRCRNGQCVPKSAFCDGKVDCSDGTDEPVICTCAEYLKLTAPGRVCDGVRHCLDKTDESPEVCHCVETSFKCNAESKNLTCVTQDFVCDGDNDCPNGEDEAECRKVEKSMDNGLDTGEVMQRSYGVWHSQCFSSPVMSQEEAKTVCQKIGYTDGVIDRENEIFNEPVVPSRDDFYMIRLNPSTWITMRDDKPLITLVEPKEPCYRLFVKCN